jgi:hypothetical protein
LFLPHSKKDSKYYKKIKTKNNQKSSRNAMVGEKFRCIDNITLHFTENILIPYKQSFIACYGRKIFIFEPYALSQINKNYDLSHPHLVQDNKI